MKVYILTVFCFTDCGSIKEIFWLFFHELYALTNYCFMQLSTFSDSYNYNYKFITSNKCKKDLLMCNGHTYSQRNLSSSYYCSSKDLGCKARIKLGIGGKIVSSYLNHIHDPPKYFKTKTGEYIRKMERNKRLFFNDK